MDPFLFALIMAFLLVKGSVEDLTYAFKGKESPRIRARKERMENKSVAAKLAHAAADRLAERIVSGPKPKGPLRRYCAGLWEDAWDTATESRRHAKEEKAAKAKAAADPAEDADPLGEVPDPPRGTSSAGEDEGGRATSGGGTGGGTGGSSSSDDEAAASGGSDADDRGRRRWWRRRPSWWTWYTPPSPEPEVEEEPTVVKATAERTDGPAPEEPKAVTTGPAALPAGSSDPDAATEESTARAGSSDEVIDGEVVDADVLCDKNCKNSTISPAEARAQGLCPNCGGHGDRRTKDFHGLHEHIKCNVCGGNGKFNDPNDKSPEDTRPKDESDSTPPATERPVTSSAPEPAALPGGSTTMSTSTETTTASEGGLTNAIKYGEAMVATCDNAVASLDKTVGSLSSEDYSGDATGGFTAAKDGFTAAKAQIERSLASLRSSLQVKDAYNANQDAGTKESVTRE